MYIVQGPRGAAPAALGTFPGQPGNPVGHLSAPGYPGSLTTWPGGSLVNGSTYSFFDFDVGGIALGGSNITFVGCRFQSNSTGNVNIQSTGTNNKFSYCSIVPRIALQASIPNAAWPSAGAGLQIVPGSASYTNTGGFCTPADNSYQYGINITSGSNLTVDHCDIWGFGNAIVHNTSGTIITDCWIHDAANCNVAPTGQGSNYHTDGPGYLNGGGAPGSCTVRHCTIATIGNTNGIAFQAATTAYSNMSVTNCYLSGFGYLVDMCHGVTGSTNLTFTDNTFGTDLPWVFGPIYTGGTVAPQSQFVVGNNNLWRRNKIKVIPGTSPIGGSNLSFTSADDGKFLLPDTTLNTVDWAS